MSAFANFEEKVFILKQTFIFQVMSAMNRNVLIGERDIEFSLW